MMKQASTVITVLFLPVVLFAMIYFGMTLFARSVEPSSTTETKQHMLSPKEPSNTCGNGICEKIERNNQQCDTDC